MSDWLDRFWLVIMVAFALLLGIGAVKERIDTWWRNELARRGVAHYYLDAENRRQWDWKKPEQSKP